MAENSFSTPSLAHPILPTIPISSAQFRCLFSKKTGTPHPPYPVEPTFFINNSNNNIHINDLHFKHIYQLVTVNRPFCPLFGPKKRRFRPKPSPFRQFSQPFLVDPEKVLFRHSQTVFGGSASLVGVISSSRCASGSAEKCAKKLRGACG
ncbi:MAG: hypothetical protein ABR907_15235, partial [Terracidiphilus sp.]